jgi:uncharacterized protein YndB with AHSA1/START domain
MKVYEATSTIDADPQTIWSILIDAPSYSQWKWGVKQVEGRIGPGEKIKVVSEANPGRSFPVKVSSF